MVDSHTPTCAAPAGVYRSDEFGAVIVRTGEIVDSDWRLAREVARQRGTSELRSLLDLGLLSEDAVAQHVARYLGVPVWDPDEEPGQLSEQMPREFMSGNGVLAFDRNPAPADDANETSESAAPGVLTLVVADPSDHHTWRTVRARFGVGARIEVGTQKQIRQYLDEHTIDAHAGDTSREESIDVSGELSALRDMASEAPVIRFFNQSIERAIDLGASDVHLERFDRRVSLRFRVDGLLVEQPPPPVTMYDALLCRIKIMANLDIAERRRAQDGRVQMRFRGRALDLRISIVPTMYGQDAAIRLQDRQRLADIDLNDLGFGEEQINQLIRAARKSHGIVLITGPTGSGKTTTLYALLRQLVSTERKIITVEDPVEYAMDGVNQIQVNTAVDLTFDRTLRNILRHDPDVVLIGEIRDQETAEMAFQASLTGHMVLSTLHTNDVPGTFMRLVDMGVEPYLVNAAVEGVSAQRLLRRLCSSCQNEEADRTGCKRCGGIGYRGRVAVMEFSGMPGPVKRMMLDGAEEHRIREALYSTGFRSMHEDARRLIDDKITDMAEVARVLGHDSSLDLDGVPDHRTDAAANDADGAHA